MFTIPPEHVLGRNEMQNDFRLAAKALDLPTEHIGTHSCRVSCATWYLVMPGWLRHRVYQAACALAGQLRCIALVPLVGRLGFLFSWCWRVLAK